MATVDEKARSLMIWLGDKGPDIDSHDLNEAMYTLNESSRWPDVDMEIRNKETVILCWLLVERLQEEQLPDECKL